jgi:hypothetical protein
MRLFNWAETFEKTPTCDNILKKVRRTEVLYWIYMILSVGVTLWGLDIIRNAPEDSIKEHAMGLFLALAGIVYVAIVKIWAHIRLHTYFLIWESKNRIEAEIRKSEAADL